MPSEPPVWCSVLLWIGICGWAAFACLVIGEGIKQALAGLSLMWRGCWNEGHYPCLTNDLVQAVQRITRHTKGRSSGCAEADRVAGGRRGAECQLNQR